MSGSDEPADLARQMREKAQQLAEAAERTSDPHERERLQKKSRTMRGRGGQPIALEAGAQIAQK
ncbi:DUF6381 family protein [Streptomyces anulatus]|uniref:DUF6381 family protein n=1 Tax=Streptomyces anulatus TaxID=1892 RepID=UPI0036478998